MKKKLGIALLLIAVIASGIGYYIMWKSSSTTTTTTSTTTSELPTPTLTGEYPALPMPTEILSKENFTINYVSVDQTYYITLTDAQYENTRDLAEQALLKQLKLTEQQACTQIKVNISMPYYVLKSVQPTYTAFSFCSQ